MALDFITRPRSVFGAVSAAVAVTAVFVGFVVLTMALIASRWLFNASHDLIWNLGFLSAYALVAAFALAQKAREGQRKPPSSTAHPRNAGPGDV